MFEFIKGIILFIWTIIKFLFNVVLEFFNLIFTSTAFVSDFLGISYAPKLGPVFAKLLVFGAVACIYSIVPDLITYYGCRLSKKYNELTTKEEKKEYTSKHTHFILRFILEIINSHSIKKAEKMENLRSTLNDASMPNENVNEMVQNNIQSLSNENETKSNIKVIYSSNLIGNMIRKGTILKRRFLTSDKPVLINFDGEPKEFFTNSSCSRDSGISFEKDVDGKTVRTTLDNPEFLKNNALYDDISLDKLKELKEKLLKDANYQVALKSFFTANDKAMKLEKK